MSTCSGTWKSPLATAGRPAAATQANTRWRLISSKRCARERSSGSRQNRRVVRPGIESGTAPCGWAAISAAPASRASSIAVPIPRSTATNRFQPHRDGVGAARAVGRIVVGQLEAGDDKHPVEPLGSRCLLADRGEVRGVALLRDHLAAADHVVGDAEDVESATSVQVDDLVERQVAVAPCRVGMELAQKRRLHARKW